jgi:GT2 family glycosyltransferase
MDADDISLPERLEKQVKYLDEQSEIMMAGTWTIRIDEKGQHQGLETYPTSHAEIRRTIFVHNPFAHGTMMLRRSVVEHLGHYDVRFLHNEDYDLWLRIVARYKAANIAEPLVLRRVHAKNITVEKELELVHYRIRTLQHAIQHYYRSPFYYVFLLRPYCAYLYRKIRAQKI